MQKARRRQKSQENWAGTKKVHILLLLEQGGKLGPKSKPYICLDNCTETGRYKKGANGEMDEFKLINM